STTASSVAALPSWKYGACWISPRSGVVRYALLAVRIAYAPSVPVSDGGCSLFAPLLSVPVVPTWQVIHDWLNTTRPRRAAAASAAPAGGALRLCWYSRNAASFDVTRSGDCRTERLRRGSEKLPWPCIWVTAT